MVALARKPRPLLDPSPSLLRRLRDAQARLGERSLRRTVLALVNLGYERLTEKG
jgi:hypothetical protein